MLTQEHEYSGDWRGFSPMGLPFWDKNVRPTQALWKTLVGLGKSFARRGICWGKREGRRKRRRDGGKSVGWISTSGHLRRGDGTDSGSGVPTGLASLCAVFPALKRWATIVRPCGAGVCLCNLCVQVNPPLKAGLSFGAECCVYRSSLPDLHHFCVVFPALKRWAKFGRSYGARIHILP